MFFYPKRKDDIFIGPLETHCGGKNLDLPIFESAEEDDAAEDMGDRQFRAAGMSAVLAWVSEGTHTFEAMDMLAVGMVDLDGDEEVTESEEEDYNDLWNYIADAMIRMGAAEDDVDAFVNDEDDAAGGKIGKALAKKLDATEVDDEELITRFASRAGEAILEAAVKVVRDGKVVLKKKRVKKYRMSPAQRATLKKARRKANTAGAKRARAKSMRMRQKRGM